MNLRYARIWTLFLDVVIFVTLFWQARDGHPLDLSAFAYLVAAVFMSIFADYLMFTSRMSRKSSSPQSDAWVLATRATSLILVGSGVAIIGLLNLWPFEIAQPQVSISVGYLLTAAFAVLSYKLLAIADSAKQLGGSKPINYFGRPRSRRIFLLGFIVTPILPFIYVSAILGDAEGPILLRPPQSFLLVAALLAVMSTAFIFQRYRGVIRNDSRFAIALALAGVSVLTIEAIAQVVSNRNTYRYALSSFIFICLAGSLYWISLAKEGQPSSVEPTR